MSRDKEEFNAHFQQVKQRAFGRWTEILLALGVDAKVLNQRNQPCPLGGLIDLSPEMQQCVDRL